MRESHPRQGVTGIDSGSSDKEFSCPSCDRSFGTERGRSLHHVQKHDESIAGVDKECATCGKIYNVKKNQAEESSFCSSECKNKWQQEAFSGEGNPSYKGKVDVECEYCENDYPVWPAVEENTRFCSMDCKANWQSENRRSQDHPNYNGGLTTVICEHCGGEYKEKPSRVERTTFCSQECHDEYRRVHGTMAGENSPHWKGGKIGYYGPNWHQKREQALERDSHTCQDCGVSDDLHVHHIRKIRQYKDMYGTPEWYEKANELDNLLTLCQDCHRKWEGIPLRFQTD